MEDVQTIPILASLDFDETEDFYCHQLGFVRHGRFDTYLLLRYGPVELHFWLADDRRLSENTSCYIRGGGVVGLYDAFRARTLKTGRLSEFEVRPWNMKEFYLFDPHGNLLRFGCAPEEVGG